MIRFDDLWDYNRPDETRRRLIKLLEEQASKEGSDYKAELLTQIARTEGLQGQFEAAHQTLDEAELLLADDMPAARVRYLLERGRVYNSSSRPDLAVPYFRQAWDVACRHELDFYAVDAAHMLGIAGDTREAKMEWNLKALAYAEAKPAAKRWLGSLYNNIGWAQVDAGNLDEAQSLFERALAFREEQGNAENIGIAKWCLAKVLRLQGQAEKALEMQQALLKAKEDNNEPAGFICEELAEGWLLLGDQDQARHFFALAYEQLVLDSWLAAHEPERLARIKGLAKL